MATIRSNVSRASLSSKKPQKEITGSKSSFRSWRPRGTSLKADRGPLFCFRAAHAGDRTEKDKNEYLKDTAFVLHDISAFLDELMEKRNPEWEAPLRFDKLHIEGERKKKIISEFSGYTPYGAILKLKEETANIIADFRLEAFRRRAGSA
jgi:hypothetical protein